MRRLNKGAGILWIVHVLLLLACTRAYGADVTLAWDPNTEPDLAGYKVYYGTASRTYGTPIAIGSQATYTVTNLPSGTYYFAVTAYSTSAEESGFSNEVSTTIGDTQPPTAVITSPTSGGTYSTNNSSLTMAGTASDNVGVTQVSWANNRGGSGVAGGTTSWSATGITLQSGSNILTVTARDAAGNSGTATLTVTYTPPDTLPPVITQVTSSGATRSSVTISWVTNEASDSQVEYGPSIQYGSSTTLNPQLAISHSQVLSGLQAGTLYHYRVKSRDAANNLATSPDFTFLTESAQATCDVNSDGIVNALDLQLLVNIVLGVAAPGQVGDINADGKVDVVDIQLLVNVVLGANSCPSSSPGPAANPTSASENGQLSATAAGATAHPSQFAAVTGRPPVLAVGTGKARAGAALDLPIDFTPGSTAVASLQFDLELPFPLTCVSASESPLVAAAGKAAITAAVARGIRVVVFGLNREAIVSGPLAHIRLNIPEDTPPGELTLTLSRISATDTSKDALPVGISGSSGSIEVTDPSDDAQLTLFYPRMFAPAYGHSGAQDDKNVGIGLVNLDRSSATLKFTAYDPAGNQVAADGITNPAVRTLHPGKQISIVDSELFGSNISDKSGEGWVKIESDVSGIAGFYLTFDGAMTVLDGAILSPTPTQSFVWTEIEDQGFTRLEVVNMTASAAHLNLELVKSDGEVRSSVNREIDANGSLVADAVDDLFHDILPARTDYIRVTSDVDVFPSSLLGKSSQYTAAVTGQDGARAGSVLFCPQYVVGGPWHSSISIVNLDQSPGWVALRFVEEGASQRGTTRLLPIAAQGKILIDDPDFFQPVPGNAGAAVVQGYVEIISNGIRLAGSVILGDRGREAFAAALPLVSKLERSAVFSHIASDESYYTGIAILNPNDTDANAVIDIYDADGQWISSATEVIPATQRASRLLTEYFPLLAGRDLRSGYVRLTVDSAVASFALLGTNDQSVLAAVPAQAIPWDSEPAQSPPNPSGAFEPRTVVPSSINTLMHGR